MEHTNGGGGVSWKRICYQVETLRADKEKIKKETTHPLTSYCKKGKINACLVPILKQ